MAWVRKIATADQVERLVQPGGRGGAEAGVAVWLGTGLADVGLVAGRPLDEQGREAARELMAGRHPATGTTLVSAAGAVRAHRRAQLAAGPLVAAVEAAARRAALDDAGDLFSGKPKQARRWGALRRMVERTGEAHRVQVDTLHRLARAAQVDLAQVYDAADLADARAHQHQRVSVRALGHGLLAHLPKTASVLWALLDTDRQEAWRGAFEESLHDAFAAYERWTAYALQGSNGHSERTCASGLLAWRVEGLTALPVDDGPGDPHLHARIAIGAWRQAADGGTDFYRHAAAFDALLQARFRALTAARFGVSWERDPGSGAWEIAGVPAAVRGAFSRRTAQIDDTAGAGASREDKLRAAAATARARTPDHDLAELRALWRQRAGQIVADVDTMVAAVAPGGGTCGGPRLPGLQDITASVIQHHRELADAAWFDTAQAMAAVADCLPDGIDADCDLTLLSRAVLTSAGAVPISSPRAAKNSNATRYSCIRTQP